jgi:signal transduction histidine kinase/CheY-like chemotaxis protein
MSELSKLHRKIADEMAAKPAPLPRAAFPEHAIPDEEGPEASAEPAQRFAALRIAIAGAGLLASAAILWAGLDTDHVLLPVGLSLAGLAGTALVLFGDTSRRRLLSPAERKGDRDWEAREADTARLAIHDALGDMAILRDGRGLILDANEIFCRSTGVAKPEGLRCDALGLDLRPAGTSGRYTVRFVTTDGPRMFDWHDVLIRDGASGSLRIVSVGRDMTDTVNAARDSKEALRRAEAESLAKSRLLATVSHEIRTPLSGILGMSDLLDQTRLSPQQSNYLAGMRQSGHDLVQLVDDLLDCASMEAGRFVLRPSGQTLRPLVESVVEMLSHRAHEKGIEIASTVAADVPESVLIDGPRLKQVLFNVVGNAVKFTKTGGVLVSCIEQGGALVLRVSDTGPGMSTADQVRIFDAFEQAGDAAAQAAGTGLGLAISRRIIQAFGGDITVTSRLGAGSIFEIRLPLASSSLARAPERHRLLSASHVLLVAPKGPAAEALAATIETLGGRCRVVSDLAQARHLLQGDDTRAAALTDIIVDHRQSDLFRDLCKAIPDLEGGHLRRTYLVNPEERSQQPLHQTDGFHAWLIRPLRERSLVAVLTGELKGIEVRDALNDNRPVLRDQPEVSTPQQCRIILAEDDPVNAAILQATLQRSGHAVTLVTDFTALQVALEAGLEARLTGKGQPPLLVTDLNMPGGSAVTMLQRLRRSERARAGAARLPVIVQTSDRREQTRRDLLEAGADVVLEKPIDAATLAATISRLIAG